MHRSRIDDLFADHPTRRTLRALRELSGALERLEATLVVEARRAGIPWWAIGKDLAVCGTTAWRRHGAADPIAAARRAIREDLERELGGPLPY